ncbi:SDR family NAD(P)-dependent oxidoreductase [Mycobacteroides abscessus]|uniref:SDR family NAD(P)-dependent oxidoreductase n=1 Tax=Mycobacteroides abscessus TaxID=36809 RepID=UPI0023509CEE
MLSFAGQVAIVTGSGRGIGRATALALGKRGAKVLVNDYGGGFDTLTPGTNEVAQSVVDEIVAAGGEAVADGTAVGTGESARVIVESAMKAFGRVDILVNNAGGSRPFHNVDEDADENLEGVIRSNLIGSLMLMRRVWPIMRDQNYGRIVNTSSNTVLGQQGMLAYVAAKGGIIGISGSAAIEGGPLGILVNTIFPQAYTRSVDDTAEPGTMDWFKSHTPELVAEGVAFLCSRECNVSGELFRIGGGRFSRYGIYGNKGVADADLTAEFVAERFDQSRDMADAEIVPDAAYDMARFNSALASDWQSELKSDWRK